MVLPVIAKPMDLLIPDDVIKLLREHVISLDRLETLLDLRRERARGWRSMEIASRVHLPVEMVESALVELRTHGLATVRVDALAHRSSWRYAPASDELAAVVGRLASFYEAHRPETVRTLGALAIGRIRSSAARAFFLHKAPG